MAADLGLDKEKADRTSKPVKKVARWKIRTSQSFMLFHHLIAWRAKRAKSAESPSKRPTRHHGTAIRLQPRERAIKRGPLQARRGQVAEWFKAPVLKTGEGVSSPWVRIPPCPPILAHPVFARYFSGDIFAPLAVFSLKLLVT
jgi:hypothetical protein